MRKLIININTYTGEYINLNLPVDFVRRMIDNNCFDFFYYKEDAIDSEKFLKLVKDALNYNLTGYIGEIRTNNDNVINLSIEHF